MAIRRASAKTTANQSFAAASSQTPNMKLIAPATATTIVGGATIGGGTVITNLYITDSNYNVLDDQAISTLGGYVKINGTGFQNGCVLYAAGTAAISTVFVSSTEVRAQLGPASSNTLHLYLVNPDNTGAIYLTGIVYSGVPAWVTNATLPQQSADQSFSINLSATSNSSITYSLSLGSSLPPGVSLASNGTLSGTVTGIAVDTIYSFSIDAIDAELQDTARTFSLSVVLRDVYFSNVSLLVGTTNSNLAQNNTFIDSSANNFSITRTGNVAPGSFTPFPVSSGEVYSTVVNSGSGYFDGTDYLSTADNAALNPGTSDFLMEAWVYITGTTGVNQGINGKGTAGTNGYSFYITNALVPSFIWNGTGGATITSSAISLNTWNHLCVVRTSNVIRLYTNGTGAANSTASTTDITSTATKYIGQARGANPILGYMSGYRMIKGTLPSGYNASQSTITVPTAPLSAVTGTSILLNFTNANIYDKAAKTNIETLGNSQVNTAVKKYNVGSVAFSGGNDFLFSTSNTGFVLGTGDFTVEAWSYLTAAGDAYRIIIAINYPTSKTVTVRYGNTGFGQKLQVAVQGDTVSTVWSCSSTQTSHLNQWVHIAFTRQSGVCKLFVNGTLQNINSGADPLTYPDTSFTDTTNVTGTTNVVIGSGLVGYIEDLRVTKGVARYTANFTPPASAFLAR